MTPSPPPRVLDGELRRQEVPERVAQLVVGGVEEPVHGPRHLLLRQEPLVVAAERGQGLGVGRRTQSAAQLVQELGDELGLAVVYRNYTCFVLVVGVGIGIADDEEVARDLCGTSRRWRGATKS